MKVRKKRKEGRKGEGMIREGEREINRDCKIYTK